ncbi:hypothetical protein [Streptomyces sp. NPDC018833]|uniref:hypothetical protein n=1 Tax=Streptomyces sp. NPDC018833 TaxID=3365053 RepID=UPI00378D1E69
MLHPEARWRRRRARRPPGVGGHSFGAMGTDLPEGATLALYTNGPIEARCQDIEVGLVAVRAELARFAGQLEETRTA